MADKKSESGGEVKFGFFEKEDVSQFLIGEQSGFELRQVLRVIGVDEVVVEIHQQRGNFCDFFIPGHEDKGSFALPMRMITLS